ncbi:IS3 family transposase [Burkholderia ambifaria]|uniref:IS3-like element IS407 family transposase n=1 Tax=Burkholderia ambifaria TaxID=152480 RepID=UPI001E31521F|nr:IS3-like element IS407 family transposase [Burkholderia ambifaria]UEP51435.1 IS3 family transposase [Burkholderia ambifaria]
MKKRFTEQQIIGFLKEAEAGMPVKELCRKHGFSDASFYTWRAKFGGMEVSEARRLKDLEVENARLKKLLAEAMLDMEALKVVVKGKPLSPQAKRKAVSAIREKVNISERRACRLVGLSRSVLHYDAKPDHENEVLAARLVELAHERRRFGYRRLHALVEREGTHANHKRIYRLYREAGLAVRRRRKRHGVMIEREQLALPGAPNEVWSIDFVMDALSNGRRVKCLTVVDDFTKEAVDIVVDHGISGLYVARALDRAARFRGYPKAVRTDQGPEFTSRALDQWAYANGVTLKLIQAGKPTQNAYIESFNGKFRDECLNEHWFTTLAHARAIIAAWRQDYNEQRPHSALNYLAPSEFAAKHRATADAPAAFQELV